MVTLANMMGDRTRLVMHAHISEECNLNYTKKIYDKICEYKKFFQNEDIL